MFETGRYPNFDALFKAKHAMRVRCHFIIGLVNILSSCRVDWPPHPVVQERAHQRSATCADFDCHWEKVEDTRSSSFPLYPSGIHRTLL